MKDDVNGTKIRRNQLIYVGHQLANAIEGAVFSDIVAFGMYGSAMLIICFTFGAFKFANASFAVLTSLFIMANIILGFSLKAAMTLAISCHTTSEACCGLGLEQIGSQNTVLTKMFWKSQRPVSIRVGNHFILDSNEYILTIFGTIILENVINLLLTF